MHCKRVVSSRNRKLDKLLKLIKTFLIDRFECFYKKCFKVLFLVLLIISFPPHVTYSRKIKTPTVWFSYRLCDFPEEKKFSLIDTFSRFKLVDKEVVEQLTSVLIDLIKNHVNLREEWIIAIPSPFYYGRELADATQRLALKVADRLGLRVCYIKQKQWALSYSALSPLERVRLKTNVMEIEDKMAIKDKNVILFDDIVATGANMREMMRVASEAGAKKIVCFSLLDIREDYTFEDQLYRYLKDNPDLLIGIINNNRGDVSLSGTKFLIRLAKENEGLFKKIWTEIDEKSREVIADKAALYLNIASKDSIVLTLDFLTLALGRPILSNSEVSQRIETLREVKTKLMRGALPPGEVDTLFISSKEWPNPSYVLMYAYLTGYNFVVFKDRREMERQDTEEVIKGGEILKISVCSPYYTTLPREVYAKDEDLPLDPLIEEIKTDLDKFKQRVTQAREDFKNSIQDLLNSKIYAPEEYLRGAGSYSNAIKGIIKELLDFLIDKIDTGSPLINKKDIAVILVGSFAKGTPTVDSDIEFDIIVNNENTRKFVVDRFGLLVVQCLRKIGLNFDLSDKLYKKHLENGYSLKTVEQLMGKELSDDDKKIVLSRLLDYSFLWGNEELFKEYLGSITDFLFSDYHNLSAMLQEVTDSYYNIMTQGEGRMGRRNYLIVYDRERQKITDLKWLIRLLECGLKERMLTGIYKAMSGEDLDQLHSLLPITVYSSIGWLQNIGLLRGDKSEIERMLRAWKNLLLVKEVKALYWGNNTPVSISELDSKISDISKMWEEYLDEIRNFVEKNVISQRRDVD